MKVLAINDLSGFGRVALTSVISVLSIHGHQCVAVPTSVFSTHAGFASYKMQDLTDNLIPTLDHYKALNLEFDCIFIGYLSSITQINIVKYAIELFPNAKVLIDPVMADNGKIYSAFSNEMCQKIRQISKFANILTPNITEAKILAGKLPNAPINSIQEVQIIAKEIVKNTEKTLIITGIELNPNEITTLIYENGIFSLYSVEKIDSYYPGTGDLFASVFLAQKLCGKSTLLAVEKACNFVCTSIKNTLNSNENPMYGVIFEPLLKTLID